MNYLFKCWFQGRRMNWCPLFPGRVVEYCSEPIESFHFFTIEMEWYG